MYQHSYSVPTLFNLSGLKMAPFKYISLSKYCTFFFVFSCIQAVSSPPLPPNTVKCCLVDAIFMYVVRFSRWVLFDWWQFCEFLLRVIVVTCSSCWVITSPVQSSTFHDSGWPKCPPSFLGKLHFLPPVILAPNWTRFSHPEDGSTIVLQKFELTNLKRSIKTKKCTVILEFLVCNFLCFVCNYKCSFVKTVMPEGQQHTAWCLTHLCWHAAETRSFHCTCQDGLRISVAYCREGLFAEPAEHFNYINMVSCNTVRQDKEGIMYRLTFYR